MGNTGSHMWSVPLPPPPSRTAPSPPHSRLAPTVQYIIYYQQDSSSPSQQNYSFPSSQQASTYSSVYNLDTVLYQQDSSSPSRQNCSFPSSQQASAYSAVYQLNTSRTPLSPLPIRTSPPAPHSRPAPLSAGLLLLLLITELLFQQDCSSSSS